MNRRAVAATILIIWLVTVAGLLRRHYWHPDTNPLADAAFSLPPGAKYFAVSLGDEQIGYASSTIDTLADTLRVTDLMVLELPVLGEIHRTSVRTEAVLSRSLHLRSFTAWLRSDGSRFSASGRVLGDTALTVELDTDGDLQTLTVRLEHPIVLATLMPLNLAFSGELEVGRSYRLAIFDPVLMQERDVTLTIAAESTFVVADSAVLDSATARFVPVAWDTVQAWQIRQEGAAVPFHTWIDDLGQVVRATSAAGFVMQRSAFEIAYENFRRDVESANASAPGRTAPSGDVIRQTAIASDVTLDRSRLDVLRVRLGGVELSGLDLDGAHQRLSADTLTVRRPAGDDLVAQYRVPARAGRFPESLSSEPLIQSTDLRIRAQARQIVGRERRPERAARRLLDWVYQNLDKQVSVSVPSAVAVFETRRGDCNEHTVLFVALARAVGLPARTAAGLVYLDGRFYYHAWPEVYLDGWVPVDPTFGQFPADATHLRFTIGGLASQMELIRLVGRLTIDVLETED
ncbi:MAG: transglutaminase domain-containing protein [Gemmatimonadetes bacterium]|nr:transglutaminase domain-containing protein [Gemmatimonadota bacterium]